MVQRLKGRHQSDIEEWEWLEKVESFLGSSRDRKPTRELQQTNDENHQENQEHRKDLAESIEEEFEEIAVTRKGDERKQIKRMESLEQEIQENENRVGPNLEIITTEKLSRDSEGFRISHQRI
ncbi:hypothetical protein JTB14_008938 [Gonioctena quinquepunctata]|nr:hypothetical protein JTB14_008938 [Gonioctena quinquepunctata]